MVDATGSCSSGSGPDTPDRRRETGDALTTVVALTRAMCPGDVSRPRSDEARRLVEGFIANGGEDGPNRRRNQQLAEALTRPSPEADPRPRRIDPSPTRIADKLIQKLDERA